MDLPVDRRETVLYKETVGLGERPGAEETVVGA